MRDLLTGLMKSKIAHGVRFLSLNGRQNLVFSVVAGSLLFMAPISLALSLLTFKVAELQAGIGLCVLPLLFIIALLLYKGAPADLRKYYVVYLMRITVWVVVMVFIFFSPPQMPRF